MKKITDRDFKYVPSTSTDIRKTFARIRKEQKDRAEVLAAAQQECAKLVQQGHKS